MLYPNLDIQPITRFYKEYKKCIINGEEYTSLCSRSERSCAIAAKWRGIIGIDGREEAPVRVGRIISFIHHATTLRLKDSALSSGSTSRCTSSTDNHIIARVEWLGIHPCTNYFHSSVLVCSTVPDHESAASFMPISRIMCRCSLSKTLSLSFNYGMDKVFVSVPVVHINSHGT